MLPGIALTLTMMIGIGQPRAQSASPAPAATPASASGESVNTYQRRIRQAITPDEVRLACRAPRGSIVINNEIIICAEADRELKYRVPSTSQSREVDPTFESPTATANANLYNDRDSGVSIATRAAPVGLAGDTFRPGTLVSQGGGVNPVKIYRSIKKAVDKADEDAR